MDITSLTAVELGKKIKAKQLSVADAVKASLDQIDRVEKDVHSFVTIDREGAFRRADEVQKQIDRLREYRWQSRTTCVRKGC